MALKIDDLNGDTLDALRERGHSDEQIEAMSPSEAFSEYCNWHGLLGWGNELWSPLMLLIRSSVSMPTTPIGCPIC